MAKMRMSHYITTMREKPAGKKEKCLVKNIPNQTMFQTLL